MVQWTLHPVQEAQVRSLVRELRSRKLHGLAKKKEKKVAGEVGWSWDGGWRREKTWKPLYSFIQACWWASSWHQALY